MKKFTSVFLFTILIGCFSLNANAQEGKWIKIFNGKNLDGWSIHSGTAQYRVENGEIIGASVPNSPYTFLCTDKEYSDFILEFEVFLVSPELNSGVQFRSQIAEEETVFWFRGGNGEYHTNTIPADQVYGYQVEIASNGSAGGVYDGARRAMVDPWWPEKGSEESKAFKNGE